MEKAHRMAELAAKCGTKRPLEVKRYIIMLLAKTDVYAKK